jgi:hypothetical protein
VLTSFWAAAQTPEMRRMDKDSKQNQVVNLRGCYGVTDPEWRAE